MKKILPLGFQAINLTLIIFYLYPGSILGVLFYNDSSIQPQITRDFLISSNHFYAFIILSIVGVIPCRELENKYFDKIFIFTLNFIRIFSFHNS